MVQGPLDLAAATASETAPDVSAVAVDGFGALYRLLLGQDDGVQFAEQAYARLARVLRAYNAPSERDLAVLIRQALRYASEQKGGAPAELLLARERNWPSFETWQAVGVQVKKVPHGLRVSALPWRPSWLPDLTARGVDAAAAGEDRRRHGRSVPGDPFLLEHFGREKYQSSGQRAAIRAALTTPPGATLLICLPTGEGKSFVFQIVSRLGYQDGDGEGITLVVTPTVALAEDHERAAAQLGFEDIQRAYRGGAENAVANRQLAERIAEGRQGLCFASAEAVCGPLRWSLLCAAEIGALRALVIDEAHLVDGWGADFRSDMQLLAGVRRELLRKANGFPPARTLLLSATLTEEAIVTLRTLFGPGAGEQAGQFGLMVAAHLRTEIDYWAAPVCTEDQRIEYVLEALDQLPRPAILYTTERKDAKAWHKRLRERGFRRLSLMTGDSSSVERGRVIDGWRAGSLDLVVGTSAFGLGIDNGHVRTVIHACVPETMDRFYQEVGRGGRDGNASVSLILPTWKDLETAKGMNHKRLISVELGFERWRQMFNGSTPVGDYTYAVPLDVRPGTEARYIDMVSDLSAEWNARTLALMANAGLIGLDGVQPQHAPEQSSTSPDQLASAGLSPAATPIVHTAWQRPRQVIRLLNLRHLEQDQWAAAVRERKRAQDHGSRENLEAMQRYVRGDACVAHILAPLYTVDLCDPAAIGSRLAVSVLPDCGGCMGCRGNLGETGTRAPAESPQPWQGQLPADGAGRSLTDSTGRLLLLYEGDLGVQSADWTEQFERLLGRFARDGVRNLVVLGGASLDVHAVQRAARRTPIFVADTLFRNGLPHGPTMIVMDRGSTLSPRDLESRTPGQERLFIVPADMPDPTHPNELLRERYVGRKLTVEEQARRLGV